MQKQRMFNAEKICIETKQQKKLITTPNQTNEDWLFIVGWVFLSPF